MKKLRNFVRSDGFSSTMSSIAAVIVGLLFGLIVLFITNSEQALDGFKTIVAGGFTGGMSGLGDVLYVATPLILTGLSIGFAFKTGLFNIGASGQLIVGAYVAILIGIKLPMLGSFHWIVALLGAMAAGALWASLGGILKAFFNVNEVITGIMTNYIGMYLVNMLVVETVYNKLKNQSHGVAKTAVLPKMGLDKIFAGSSANSGIIIAILIAILIYIILNKTVFGYELTACGYNPDASDYAGINSKKNIILSMVIAGALAGCAGGLMYLAGSGKYIRVIDVLAAEGFTGIPVALLGLSNPIGIIFAALFIGYITMGGFYMQLYDFAPEIIDIITSVIIYFSAFALIIKNLVQRTNSKRSRMEKEKAATQINKGGNEDE